MATTPDDPRTLTHLRLFGDYVATIETCGLSASLSLALQPPATPETAHAADGRQPGSLWNLPATREQLADARPREAAALAYYLAARDAFNAADPIGLFAADGDPWTYEREVAAFFREWWTADLPDLGEVLLRVLALSFVPEAVAPEAIGTLRAHLEPVFATRLGPAADRGARPAGVRDTAWPRVPELTRLQALVPPPVTRSQPRLETCIVFPRLGPELLLFVAVPRERLAWLDHPDARMALALAVEVPVRWLSVRLGDAPTDPGAQASIASHRARLGALRPWLDQSHVHVVLLVGERVQCVFEVPTEARATPRSQAALRAGRAPDAARVRLEVLVGRAPPDDP